MKSDKTFAEPSHTQDLALHADLASKDGPDHAAFPGKHLKPGIAVRPDGEIGDTDMPLGNIERYRGWPLSPGILRAR
jgi:hypothetical protein